MRLAADVKQSAKIDNEKVHPQKTSLMHDLQIQKELKYRQETRKKKENQRKSLNR